MVLITEGSEQQKIILTCVLMINVVKLLRDCVFKDEFRNVISPNVKSPVMNCHEHFDTGLTVLNDSNTSYFYFVN